MHRHLRHLLCLVALCATGAAPAADGPDCSRPLTLALHEHGLLYSSSTGTGIDKDFADELIKRSGCKVTVTVMQRARIWRLIESDTVERIGGDEFAVLLNLVEDRQAALAVAEKIRQALNAPLDLEGGQVTPIPSSIGIAVYPEHGSDDSQLSRNADDAMYVAKALGRNNVQFYRPELDLPVPATETMA